MTLPELARLRMRPQFRNARTELAEVIESDRRRRERGPADARAIKRLREAEVVDNTGTGRGKVFVRVEDLRAVLRRAA